MADWIFAGDETGDWDKLQKLNGNALLGVALVFGRVETWLQALSHPLGANCPALEIFNQPLLPGERKYHLRDVLKLPSNDPRRATFEARIRRHMKWLICSSGLVVLALGGTINDMKQNGYFVAHDPTITRARCFAQLIGLVLPFIPGSEATLYTRLELRTEDMGHSERKLELKRLLYEKLYENTERYVAAMNAYLDQKIRRNLFSDLHGSLPQSMAEDLRSRGFRWVERHHVQQAVLATADLACLLARPNNRRFIELPDAVKKAKTWKFYSFAELPWTSHDAPISTAQNGNHG